MIPVIYPKTTGRYTVRNTALKTNMTMEKQPFKDISSMKHCDFPILVYWMANDGNII